MVKPATPKIVPRSEHTMSRKDISPAALTVLYTLKRNRHLAFLAGGSVRDLLIGRRPKDFDVVTDATPSRVKKMFRRARLVGRRFRLCHVLFANDFIEVATFRAHFIPSVEETTETTAGDTGKPHRGPPRLVAQEGMIVRDNEFGTPSEDALRRDFTINALFYDIRNFSIVDYVGGLDDLRRGLIRSIGDPDVRFVEDPVRMLRAIRFAAVLGFDIEPACRAAIRRHHTRLALANPHRLYDEWLKITGSGALTAMGSALLDADLLSVIMPGFARWLTADSDGRRQRFVMACRRLDEWRHRQDAPVAADMVFAIMMGEYLEECITAKAGQGMPWFPAAMRAVGEALAPDALAMAVPRTIVQNVARLMAVQNRFRPDYRGGRRRFREQAVFAPAFEVFRFLCETQQRPPEWLNRWNSMDATATAHGPALKTEPAKSSQRRRRPRRGRRRRRTNT